MTPTKFLFGQIIIVFAVVLATTWFATQWTAWMLGYQAPLGPAWFFLGGQPVYPPHRLYEWWYAYSAYAPHVFNKAGIIAAGGGFLGIAVAIAGSLWRARQSGNLTTYGSSRWARRHEIKKAGLFEPEGVFIGRYEKDYLRHDGPEHVMAFAPTRSGKGVGLVIPTLLSWTGSAVIHDIKGENWNLTAGWRSNFSHCLLFDPTNPESACYNPLLEVRKGISEVRDVQNIADILADPQGSPDLNTHWVTTAKALLVGTILHVLYAEKEKTLARVVTFLSDPNRSFDETLYAMLATNHLGDDTRHIVHPTIASSVREVFNKSINERSGVLSTAMTFLSLYRDPIANRVTSKCDWRIDDLMWGEHPVSLYLVIPPSDISRTKPLIRLILNQIGRRLTESLDQAKYERQVNWAYRLKTWCKSIIFPVPEGEPETTAKHKLLMMLDEFPLLGRLDFFETALAFMAGYGIRAYMIAQSLNQIDKAYGEFNSVLDNCHVRVAFATNDERTAKRISDGLGTTTEQRAQKNYAGHRLAPWLSHVMVSRQETPRQLMTPGEVMQLSPDDQLVMLAGQRPIKASKIRYYEDQNFIDRVQEAPSLSPGEYKDRPKPRPCDWSGMAARIDKARLSDLVENRFGVIEEEDDGLKRHPSLDEDRPGKDVELADETLLLADVDTDNPPATRNMDIANQMSRVQAAHAMSRGGDNDLDF